MSMTWNKLILHRVNLSAVILTVRTHVLQHKPRKTDLRQKAKNGLVAMGGKEGMRQFFFSKQA